jgi:predicted HTH domain antitoxin
MHTHALTSALTLYRSGTLSLTQAAHLAGVSESELRRELGKYGIPVREAPADTRERADSAH